MSEASPILLISGPPGAGKTTIARRLVETWGAPVAYVEGDEFWKFFPARARGATREDGRILVQAMIATAARFARGGYDTIADFSVRPRGLDAIRAGLKDIALDYVVVCPSERVCATRAAERGEGAMPDYAPYRELHAAFAQLGALEPHAIRDDRAEADELAARIHSGLARGAFRLPSG